MFHVLFANIYMDKAFGVKLTIKFFFNHNINMVQRKDGSKKCH